MHKIIILSYLFLIINCQTEFLTLICLFPRSFSLYNGNNLLCCKNGIYCYNSNFSEQLYFKEFTTQIADNVDADLTTISQYENNGYVILLTKDKFYFLYSYGKVKFSTDIELDNGGKYYTLVPYRNGNDYCFMVGFINSSSNLNIKYYKINISLEQIELIKDYKPSLITINGNIVTQNRYNGFDCQLMNSDTYGEIITCFHFDLFPGEIGAFSLYLNSNLEIIDGSIKLLQFESSPKYLKTVASPDKTKVLIGFSDSNSKGYYLKYDINIADFISQITEYMNIGGDYPYTVQIQYFKQTHEYIFSVTNKQIFKMAKFDIDMNIMDDGLGSQTENDFSFSRYDICGLNLYSIVLIPEYKDYAFIMDTNTGGNTTSRFYFLPDYFSPSTLYPIEDIIPTTIITTIPTTIITTIPTTIITTIPTTIITTIPTTIITTIPTTIITTIPTTIITTIPTTILTTIPTTILTTIPTTIPTTILTTIPTTILTTIPTTILTTIPTTILTTIPTTILTTIPTTILTTIPTTILTTIPTTIIFYTSTSLLSTFPETVISTVPIDSSISSFIVISTMPFKPKLNAPSTTNAFIDFSQTSLYTSPIINASTINKDLLSNSYYSTSLSQSLVSTFPINDYIINSESCSFEYFYKNIKSNECKRLCSLNEFINEMCIINNLTENNIMNITQNIRNAMTNLDINKDINLVINGNNVIYQIISSEKMDDNKNRNVSIIELGECGEKLKKMYNIDYIIILKVDIFLTNSTNVILKYEIYNPYTLEKIDLSICSGMLIDTYLPYSLSDEDLELFINLDKLGYDLFNPNDSFYHDICIPYTTFNKTDILLDDRRKDYFKNLSFCEENCTYKQYNYIYEKVQCECIIKEEEIKSNINNIKFYGNLFFSSFLDIEKFSNIKVIKCFKLVFSKIGQTNNYGSYIFIFFIFIFFILMALFYIYAKKQIVQIIGIVINQKNIKSPIKKRSNKKIKKNTNNIIINKKIIINNNNYINLKKNKKKSKTFKYDKSNKLLNINSSIRKSHSKLIDLDFKKNSKDKRNINKNFTNKSIKNIKVYKNSKNKQSYNYRDIELNYLNYQNAIKYDKRTYIQYYCSLLKQKQLILFAFISNSDYNIFTIKLSLFIFSLSLSFTITALFLDNNTIHEIYKTKGNLDYIYYLLHIIYSTIISSAITLLLKLLALSNNSILNLKKIKNSNKAKKESLNVIKQLNIRFNLYFIISFLFLAFFWYFISAFCAVYNNSQIILIENSLSSFSLSLIYPFALNLLPGIFRISALRAKDKNKNCLFSFGNLISLI